MASRSSARIRTRKRRSDGEKDPSPPPSLPNNPPFRNLGKKLPVLKLHDIRKMVVVEGLDFAGHCPICLKKLLKTERLEGEGGGGMSCKFVGRIWQYLHDKGSPLDKYLPTPKFTFRRIDDGGLQRSGRSGLSSGLSGLPSMCEICRAEVLKLSNLHEGLEAIERAVKSQVETIRKIVRCNVSQRREFEKGLSCEGKVTQSKVMQFLEYIGNEVTSAPWSSGRTTTSVGPRPRQKLQENLTGFKTAKIMTPTNGVDEHNKNDDSIPMKESLEEYQYEVFDPVKYEAEADDRNMVDQQSDVYGDEECEPDAGSSIHQLCNSDLSDMGETNEKDSDEEISDDDWEEIADKHKKKDTSIGGKTGNEVLMDVKSAVAGASSSESQHQCTECEKVYPRLTALRLHFFKCHTKGLDKGPKQLRKCDKCGKVFKYQPSLQFHKDFENCTPNDKIQLSWTCPYSSCNNKTFLAHSQLKRHKAAQHKGEKPPTFPCKICGKDLIHVGHLKTHMKTHDDEDREPEAGSSNHQLSDSDISDMGETIEDDDDDISDTEWEENAGRHRHKKKATTIASKTEKEILKDVKSAAAGASSNAVQHKCFECKKLFPRLSTLRQHFFKFHTKGLKKGPAKLMKCDKCGKVFKYQSSLQFHKDFENCTPNDKLQSWTCPYPSCNKKIFLTRNELRRHKVARHKGEKPVFSCKICGNLIHVGHLKSHMKTHEKTRPACPVCKKDFGNAKFLVKHMSIHTGEMPYCCELCGKQFRLAGFLREHKKRAHRDLNLFGTNKCDLCGKTFHTAKSLKGHMLLHTGAKPVICEVCGRGFRSKNNLRSHMKNLHSKDKQTSNVKARKKTSVACRICSKEYADRRSLFGHVRLAHTDWTPFSCDECHLGFKTKYLWRDHQNMVHVSKAKAPVPSPSNHSENVQPAEYPEPDPIITVEVSTSEKFEIEDAN